MVQYIMVMTDVLDDVLNSRHMPLASLAQNSLKVHSAMVWYGTISYSMLLTDVRDDVLNWGHAVRMTCTKLTEGVFCYGLVWCDNYSMILTDVRDDVLNSRHMPLASLANNSLKLRSAMVWYGTI